MRTYSTADIKDGQIIDSDTNLLTQIFNKI